MAFGNWREGVRADDPWNKEDKSESYVNMCKHDPEPKLVGSKLVRPKISRPQAVRPSAPKAKDGDSAKPKRLILFIILAVVLMQVIAVTTMLNVFEPAPEASVSGHDHPYNDYQEFFDEYYDSTTGLNEIERYEGTAGFEMTLDSGVKQSLSLQDIYEKCAPSIVAIIGEVDGEEYTWGSGIVLTSDGYIITNNHILDSTDAVSVTLNDDRSFPALLVGSDSFSDIAVLKIDCSGLTPAHFADSDSLRVGDDVVAIGNPLGEELRGTMTNGIVSAINRSVYMDGNYMTLIQTNAAINGGNSGGALIDMGGRVIGMTNMKMMSYMGGIEGLGFAIPTSSIKTVVDEILESGYVEGRPGIGVTVGSVPPEAVEKYDLPDGLYVSKVTPGSGADAAGILPGDIILTAEGTPVSTVAELNEAKSDLNVGDNLLVTFWRDGEVYEVDIEIMDMNRLFG